MSLPLLVSNVTNGFPNGQRPPPVIGLAASTVSAIIVGAVTWLFIDYVRLDKAVSVDAERLVSISKQLDRLVATNDELVQDMRAINDRLLILEQRMAAPQIPREYRQNDPFGFPRLLDPIVLHGPSGYPRIATFEVTKNRHTRTTRFGPQ